MTRDLDIVSVRNMLEQAVKRPGRCLSQNRLNGAADWLARSPDERLAMGSRMFAAARAIVLAEWMPAATRARR